MILSQIEFQSINNLLKDAVAPFPDYAFQGTVDDENPII